MCDEADRGCSGRRQVLQAVLEPTRRARRCPAVRRSAVRRRWRARTWTRPAWRSRPGTPRRRPPRRDEAGHDRSGSTTAAITSGIMMNLSASSRRVASLTDTIECRLRARPLLSLPDPVDLLVGTSGQPTGAVAHIDDDRVDQPRHRQGPVSQRGTYRASDAVAGYPRPGIEAERPSCDPDVVQAFHGSALSDTALPAGPRDTQFGTGGGEPLCSFRESRGADCSRSDRRGVQHQQLPAEAFDPMPGLRASIVELATVVRARRERKGGDNNDEHHRDQGDRSQQDGGHRIDGTPDTCPGRSSCATGYGQRRSLQSSPPGEASPGTRGRGRVSYAEMPGTVVPAGGSAHRPVRYAPRAMIRPSTASVRNAVRRTRRFCLRRDVDRSADGDRVGTRVTPDCCHNQAGAVRSETASWLGGAPNWRRYSRLNCDGLS